jgi:hypothetical protein
MLQNPAATGLAPPPPPPSDNEQVHDPLLMDTHDLRRKDHVVRFPELRKFRKRLSSLQSTKNEMNRKTTR